MEFYIAPYRNRAPDADASLATSGLNQLSHNTELFNYEIIFPTNMCNIVHGVLLFPQKYCYHIGVYKYRPITIVKVNEWIPTMFVYEHVHTLTLTHTYSHTQHIHPHSHTHTLTHTDIDNIRHGYMYTELRVVALIMCNFVIN